MVSGFVVFAGLTPREQLENYSSFVGTIHSQGQVLQPSLYPGADHSVIVKNLDSNLVPTLVELAQASLGTFSEAPMFASWEGENI